MYSTIQNIFYFLENANYYLWSYIGIGLILISGFYLSYKAKWKQCYKFHTAIINFFTSLKKQDKRGVNPIKAFFASLGGCIGIGNLATISVAIKIGGPGALIWVWLTALLGMILKYSEVYLGIKYRVPNLTGGYDGGTMYFLKKAFPKIKWLSYLMAFLLCIYGIEIYAFGIVKDSIVKNWQIPNLIVVITLLSLVFIAVNGGMKRLGNISSLIIPLFIIIYLGMTFFILWENIYQIPSLLKQIIISAFNGHAPIGGFLGSTLLLTISKGISSACYSGDLGIGYASILHSEASTTKLKKQASLSIFGIFLDTFIVCSCTVLLILTTGVWQESLNGSMLVQAALSKYFPYMNLFMPIFLFLVGYSTIIAYMYAGLKCAKFISTKYGPKLYYLYAIVCFIFFSFFDTFYALTIMLLSGGLLMIINILGILKLRKKIDFNF